MAPAEPLVDQHRFPQKVRGKYGRVQGRVLVATDRMVHPVKNESALFLNGKAVKAPYPLTKVVGIRPNYRQRINRHLSFNSSAMLVAALIQTKAYGNLTNGIHHPKGARTWPSDPLRMKRSEHLTPRTVGPHSGHRLVSVSKRQAICGDA
jgi:hypothetical protein